jgi:tripartite motif-containing protein 37
MFGDEHKEHKFEHLEKIYERHLQNIKKEAEFVQERSEEYAKQMDKIKTSIEMTQRAKDNKVDELTRMKKLIQEQLEKELKDKLMVLFSEKSAIGDEMKYLKNLQKDIEKEISSSTRSQLVIKSQELIGKIEEAKARPKLILEGTDVSPEFSYIK